MAVTRRSPLGPLVYGAFFAVALPAALAWWAGRAAPAVPLPALHLPWAGWTVVALGLTLLVAGVVALGVYGHGLPMNPYPPATYVDRGPYRYLAHPIYAGFAAACWGASIATGSASGLWLVSPLVALGAAALVLGYERHDLRRRFGAEALRRPLIALPADTSAAPAAWDRVSVFLLVFLPWTVVFEAAARLGVPRDAIDAHLPFERGWPVVVWTEFVYASVYPFVGLVPLVARERAVLRRFAVTALVATAVITLIYVTVPVVAPPRPFAGGGLAGRLLAIERAMANTVAAFPSFHVVWALIAAEAWGRTFPRLARWAWGWATAIAASCITTGMHALADVALAVALWPVLRGYPAVWSALRAGAERVANSWREWQWGPVRVINHGAYAAAGGAVGVVVAGALAGPAQRGGVALVAVCGLIGAGLWAQQLEGSPALARPFGYFGGVIGVVAGVISAGIAGCDWLLLLAAWAAAAPWIQSAGRLRCLVQGCCHGAPAPEAVGIRYWMPRSRVCKLAGWRGVALHPTPLYSILSHVVIGTLLARLWSLGAALGLIAGLYLLLTGLARFVEESYRGEPQTPVVRGLRLYQWFTLVFVAAGAVLTTLPVVPSPVPSPGAVGGLLLLAAGIGALCGFAMGVDFPGSSRRFARLAT